MKTERNPEPGKYPLTGKEPDGAPEADSPGFFAAPLPAATPGAYADKLWVKFSVGILRQVKNNGIFN
jgi:hypothetical protein